MNRRKFFATLGVAATGTSAAVGSGAFTSVSADRSVAVSVAGDGQAYPGSDPNSGPNGDYARTENGQLAVHLNRVNDDASKNGTGGGIDDDSSVTTANNPNSRREDGSSLQGTGIDVSEAYRNIRIQTVYSTDSSVSI